MLKFIESWFKKPSAKEIALETHEEYQRLLLEHEAKAAFHGKMTEYYREGIGRLRPHYHAQPSAQ